MSIDEVTPIVGRRPYVMAIFKAGACALSLQFPDFL